MSRDPRTMREKDLQQAIYDAARRLGWAAYHVHDARRSAPGFPDLVLVRPPRIVVAELKTEKGKTSEYQDHWLGLFRQVPGVEVYLWRPVDWLDGTVDEALAA